MTVWKVLVLALLVVGIASSAGRLFAKDDKTAAPKVGDPAPTFEATDDTGKPWKSTDHVGKKIVVVYFYAADLTGG